MNEIEISKFYSTGLNLYVSQKLQIVIICDSFTGTIIFDISKPEYCLEPKFVSKIPLLSQLIYIQFLMYYYFFKILMHLIVYDEVFINIFHFI